MSNLHAADIACCMFHNATMRPRRRRVSYFVRLCRKIKCGCHPVGLIPVGNFLWIIDELPLLTLTEKRDDALYSSTNTWRNNESRDNRLRPVMEPRLSALVSGLINFSFSLICYCEHRTRITNKRDILDSRKTFDILIHKNRSRAQLLWRPYDVFCTSNSTINSHRP